MRKELVKATTNRRDFGFGMLEAAIGILFLLSFLLSGLAITDIVQKTNLVEQIADRNVFEISVKPFILGKDLNVSFNKSAIYHALKRAAQKAVIDIKNEIGVNIPSSNYMVEVGAIGAHFDPQTGKFLKLDPRPIAVLKEGSLTLPPSVKKQADLLLQWERYSRANKLNKDSNASALPTGISTETGNVIYLSKNLLAGITVAIKLNDDFLSTKFRELIGTSSIVAKTKIFTLRGGFT